MKSMASKPLCQQLLLCDQRRWRRGMMPSCYLAKIRLFSHNLGLSFTFKSVSLSVTGRPLSFQRLLRSLTSNSRQ